MPNKIYKSNKKYQCPYCDKKLDRNKLISHIDGDHESMIPQGYSSNRLVYEIVNKKNHGICMICKQPTYTWDEKHCKYANLCDKKECKEEVRKIALERHIKVYNKPTLLGDPNHQAKMLDRRKISKKYTFSDGGIKTYTGTYEGKTVQFLDKVLGYNSDEIQMPGPILKYEYKGEKHFWITDIYIIPANLVIEVKDGGDNPNNRSMPEYRGKQIAKETMITELGTMHYLRLTNNNFEQLLDILSDIKMGYINQEDPIKTRVHINEYMAMSGVNPVVGIKPTLLSIPYKVEGKDNDEIDGIVYIKDTEDDAYICERNKKVNKVKREQLTNLNDLLIGINLNESMIDQFIQTISEKEDKYDDKFDSLIYSFQVLSEITQKRIHSTGDLISVMKGKIHYLKDEYYEGIKESVYENLKSYIDQYLL